MQFEILSVYVLTYVGYIILEGWQLLEAMNVISFHELMTIMMMVMVTKFSHEIKIYIYVRVAVPLKVS